MQFENENSKDIRNSKLSRVVYSYLIYFDSKIKYSEDEIIKMFEFLVHNSLVVFAEKVFQQIVGIPMGTNCAPPLADIFLYSYEA